MEEPTKPVLNILDCRGRVKEHVAVWRTGGEKYEGTSIKEKRKT